MYDDHVTAQNTPTPIFSIFLNEATFSIYKPSLISMVDYQKIINNIIMTYLTAAAAADC